MSDLEKILIGVALSGMVGLIVYFIQVGFSDLKKRLDEIAANMIYRDVCAERHRSVNEKFRVQDARLKELEQED